VGNVGVAEPVHLHSRYDAPLTLPESSKSFRYRRSPGPERFQSCLAPHAQGLITTSIGGDPRDTRSLVKSRSNGPAQPQPAIVAWHPKNIECADPGKRPYSLHLKGRGNDHLRVRQHPRHSRTSIRTRSVSPEQFQRILSPASRGWVIIHDRYDRLRSPLRCRHLPATCLRRKMRLISMTGPRRPLQPNLGDRASR